MSTDKTTRERAAGRPARRAAGSRPSTARRPAARAPRAASGRSSRQTGPSEGVAEKIAGAVKDGVSDPRATLAAHRVPVLVAGVVLILIVALYGPACGLYQAWRENGVLQAEEARSSAESAELEGDIDTLMTEDGIKDEARRRGYVDEGETRIIVDDGGSAEDEPADDAQGDDTPWYLGVTDFIFQYHPSDEGER